MIDGNGPPRAFEQHRTDVDRREWLVFSQVEDGVSLRDALALAKDIERFILHGDIDDPQPATPFDIPDVRKASDSIDLRTLLNRDDRVRLIKSLAEGEPVELMAVEFGLTVQQVKDQWTNHAHKIVPRHSLKPLVYDNSITVENKAVAE